MGSFVGSVALDSVFPRCSMYGLCIYIYVYEKYEKLKIWYILPTFTINLNQVYYIHGPSGFVTFFS